VTEPVVTREDYAAALVLFNEALCDIASFAEFMVTSYQEGALRAISVALARHREQALAEGVAMACEVIDRRSTATSRKRPTRWWKAT